MAFSPDMQVLESLAGDLKRHGQEAYSLYSPMGGCLYQGLGTQLALANGEPLTAWASGTHMQGVPNSFSLSFNFLRSTPNNPNLYAELAFISIKSSGEDQLRVVTVVTPRPRPKTSTQEDREMLPAASALAALIHPELGEAATRWVAQDEFRDDALRRRDAARAELRGFLGSPRSPLPKKQEVLAIVREMYDGEAGVGYVPTLFRPTYGLVEAIGNLVGSEARAFFARDYPTHKRPQHIQAFPKAL